MAEPAGEAEPGLWRLYPGGASEALIEIYEASPGQRLETCIEVLSPSKKRPGTEGWELYQRKRQSLLRGNVKPMEIDLLRGGQRMPMLDPWPDSPYTLLVAGRGPDFAGSGGPTIAVRCLLFRCHWRNRTPISR